jgi:hypothetical protein
LRPNWGDWLTPLLLARFAHVQADWTECGSADVVSVGSILGNIMGPWFKGAILGAGKLFEERTVPPNATIWALRGPLSARGVAGSFALGDPGLLADELVQIETKRYQLAIIPHWSDSALIHDARFIRYDHIVIDPSWHPLTVIRAIAESRKVVSSSLHGIILADALGIPRRFEASANWRSEGGLFKLRDHNAAVGVPTEIGKTQEADANRVSDRKTDLRDAFKQYGHHIQAARR